MFKSGYQPLTDIQVDDIARWSAKNSDSNTTLLGRWSDDTLSYNHIANENGFRYFDMGDTNWNLISETTSKDDMWRINQSFLEESINKGDDFVFTDDPFDFFDYTTGEIKPGQVSSYANELKYLYDKGLPTPIKNGGLWEIRR